MLNLGLPSLTGLYIVKSPATMFVVAPADPNEVNPAKVVILGCAAVAKVPETSPLTVSAPSNFTSPLSTHKA